MNKNSIITLAIVTCLSVSSPFACAAGNVDKSRLDILTAIQQYKAASEKYLNNQGNLDRYHTGDAILESRGCCIPYYRDAGSAPVLYRSSLLEEDSKERFLAANGDIVITRSEHGVLETVEIWDSHTLRTIASVLYAMNNHTAKRDRVVWYGYSPQMHQLSFCCESFYRTLMEEDRRFFLNLKTFEHDSVNVAYYDLDEEHKMIPEGAHYPNIPTDVFGQLGYRGIPLPETPTFDYYTCLREIVNSPMMNMYIGDFLLEKKAYDWEQIDIETLSVKQKNKEDIVLTKPSFSGKNSYKIEWEKSCDGYFAYPSHLEKWDSERIGFEEKPKPQSIYFYSCKEKIWVPFFQLPTGVFVEDVEIGKSDIECYTIADYTGCGDIGGLEGSTFLYNGADNKISCFYDETGTLQNAPDNAQYPPEMLGPDLRVIQLPGSSKDGFSGGMGALLSVWNRLRGSEDQAYWIAASEGVCSLYRIDEKAHIVKEVQRLSVGSGKIRPYWDGEHKLLFLMDTPHAWRVYKVDDTAPKAELLCYAYDNGTSNFAFVLPNGHYAGSPGCESFLISAEQDGMQVGMQALAPWRNRPAEVLEALGAPNEEVEVLQQTTQRWLVKQGFNPDAMTAEPAFKDFARVEVDMPRLLTTDAETAFDVKLCPGAKDIARLIVRADGVEIPQSSSTGTTGRAAATVSVTVPLATRENWIEVTPVDTDGISGDTCRFRVIRQGSAKPDLYIVSLGVSKYNDESLNLQYAAKDAKDLAAAFEKYGAGEKKHVLLLTDEQVQDKGCLERIKGFLQSATVEDRVVFYCAGHGLLDEKLDYYYAPAGIDPENVAGTGISMKDLQAAIAETPARERLLLLDTCHSGSVGEEDEDKLALVGALPHGVRAIQHRGMKVKKVTTALNTAQKKRYIEEMFAMGEGQRGVNVIAGSAGAEYAQESEEWNNGVFTSAIMECLKYWYRADTNQDCILSIAELEQYVSNRVGKLTGGAQKPKASSMENTGRMALHNGEKLTLEQCLDLLPYIYPANTEEAKNKQMLESMIKQCVAGGNVNKKATDGSGNTPLHYAAMLGNFHISRALLAAGASTQIDNAQYEKPDFCAKGVAQSLFENLEHQRDRVKVLCLQMDGYLPVGETLPEVAAMEKSWAQDVIKHLNSMDCTTESAKLFRNKLLQLIPRILEGADINSALPGESNTALHYACGLNDIATISWLVEHGANREARNKQGQSPADCGRLNNAHFEVVTESVLNSGDTSRPYRPVSQSAPAAISQPQSGTSVQDIICHLNAMGAGTGAAKVFRSKLLQIMPRIQNGADVSSPLPKETNTPLHYACGLNDVMTVQWLLDHGADAAARNKQGQTPADCARLNNSWDALNALERGGASQSSYQPSYSPGVSAQSSVSAQDVINHLNAMGSGKGAAKVFRSKLLQIMPRIQNGASVNSPLPKETNTPLHYACGLNDVMTVQWLLDHGADAAARNKQGQTPADCARLNNSGAALNVLQQRGVAY